MAGAWPGRELADIRQQTIPDRSLPVHGGVACGGLVV